MDSVGSKWSWSLCAGQGVGDGQQRIGRVRKMGS